MDSYRRCHIWGVPSARPITMPRNCIATQTQSPVISVHLLALVSLFPLYYYWTTSTSDTTGRSTETSLVVRHPRLVILWSACATTIFYRLKAWYRHVTYLSSSRRETGIVVCWQLFSLLSPMTLIDTTRLWDEETPSNRNSSFILDGLREGENR